MQSIPDENEPAQLQVKRKRTVTGEKPNTPAERAFRNDKRTADVLAQEESRRAAAAAKTRRLRAERLAKESAEREADPPGPKGRK